MNFVKFLQAPFLHRTPPVAASVFAFDGAGRGQKLELENSEKFTRAILRNILH